MNNATPETFAPDSPEARAEARARAAAAKAAKLAAAAARDAETFELLWAPLLADNS